MTLKLCSDFFGPLPLSPATHLALFSQAVFSLLSSSSSHFLCLQSVNLHSFTSYQSHLPIHVQWSFLNSFDAHFPCSWSLVLVYLQHFHQSQTNSMLPPDSFSSLISSLVPSFCILACLTLFFSLLFSQFLLICPKLLKL